MEEENGWRECDRWIGKEGERMGGDGRGKWVEGME